MATMFEGSRKEIEKRFENMPVREFLERLLEDDVVSEIVSTGRILVLDWTGSVKPPCNLIGFGIVRGMKISKNLYFVGVNDNAKEFFLGMVRIPIEKKKVGISIVELMEWIKQINCPNVMNWARHICEAKEVSENTNTKYLPLRFDFLSSRIDSVFH